MTEETFRIKVGSAPKQVEITVFNMKDKGEVSLVKTDAQSGAYLKDALFSITDEEGRTIYEGVTDEDGFIRLFLPPGRYTVTEIEAPQGYRLDSKPVEFILTSLNASVRIEITNDKLKDSTPGGSGGSGWKDPDKDKAGPEYQEENNSSSEVNMDPDRTDEIDPDIYESLDSEHHSMADEFDDYELVQWGIENTEGKTNPNTGQGSTLGSSVWYTAALLGACTLLVSKKLRLLKNL